MLLVTANTMAQSVRERTNEIGVLKTLGFSSGSDAEARAAARRCSSPCSAASSGFGLAYLAVGGTGEPS